MCMCFFSLVRSLDSRLNQLLVLFEIRSVVWFIYLKLGSIGSRSVYCLWHMKLLSHIFFSPLFSFHFSWFNLIKFLLASMPEICNLVRLFPFSILYIYCMCVMQPFWLNRFYLECIECSRVALDEREIEIEQEAKHTDWLKLLDVLNSRCSCKYLINAFQRTQSSGN